jgi:hypothetical protein
MREDPVTTAERVLMVAEHPALMQDWNDENAIRLARMFGIEYEVELRPVRNGLARVTQGKPFPTGSRYRPFNSLREWYVVVTGDQNINHWGQRVRQILSLTSAEDMLANVANRILMEDFAPTDYRWKDVVTSITGPPDFRQNVRGRLQYVPDIPTLTEDQPYPEIQDVTADNNEVTYSMTQQGGMLSFTRRAIINDDVELIQRAIKQVGRACWRTLAKRVWNMFITNATFGEDGLPLFCAQHGNLGTAALSEDDAAASVAALNAARAAIFSQTEPGGTDLLGLGAGPLFLAVPIQLEPVAMAFNLSPFFIDSENVWSANPWRHRFGKENENIFVNPLFTDASAWYLFDVSGKVQIAEVGFLQGRQEPHLIQSGPLTEAEFYQDRVIYKVEHDFGCVLLDYRGAYKSGT